MRRVQQQFAKANRIDFMMKMRRGVFVALILLMCGIGSAWGANRVMVKDFERVADAPTVWVVGIPNENASVGLSGDEVYEGGQALKLHYHFVEEGGFPTELYVFNRIGCIAKGNEYGRVCAAWTATAIESTRAEAL